ncbi:MAG TPA: hypothetical protein VKZ65_08330 [Glycomyces sp.]|nr:hypothetical protein [Glycomyces sp.]
MTSPVPPHRPGPSDRVAEALASAGTRIARLRLTVLAVACAAVLLVSAMLWFGGASTLDPTRRAVDDLDVSAWAAAEARDEIYGNRWCVGECRVRVRTWSSEGTVEDTGREYRAALLEDGWAPAEERRCLGDGSESDCYARDELFLELWVMPVTCADRYELCVGAEVTAVVAPQAALPRLAENRRASDTG